MKEKIVKFLVPFIIGASLTYFSFVILPKLF